MVLPANRLTPGLLAILGLLAMTSPLATDMYLASFTEIATDLSATPAAVQLTLTTFLFGIGMGQLFFGPLSDRYGRRPILLMALTVLAIDSVAIVLVPHIALLIVLRLIQGFTGAAGIVISRAIAVDVSSGPEAVKVLSLIATLVALGPLIAPMVGGFVSQQAGWRAVMAVLAALMVLMLVLTVLFVPETHPVEREQAGRLFEPFRAVGTLIRDRIFMGYVITFSMGFGAMMAYISASPFVGQSILGMNQVQYGLSFGAGAAALVLANLLNARVAVTVGANRMQLVGVSLATLGGLALLAFVLTGILSIPLFIGSAFTLTFGVGLVMSNSSALALARASSARGSGSAILGAGQFLVGGAISPIVGIGGETTAVPMAGSVAVLSLVALTFALLVRWALPREDEAPDS